MISIGDDCQMDICSIPCIDGYITLEDYPWPVNCTSEVGEWFTIHPSVGMVVFLHLIVFHNGENKVNLFWNIKY